MVMITAIHKLLTGDILHLVCVRVAHIVCFKGNVSNCPILLFVSCLKVYMLILSSYYTEKPDAALLI